MNREFREKLRPALGKHLLRVEFFLRLTIGLRWEPHEAEWGWWGEARCGGGLGRYEGGDGSGKRWRLTASQAPMSSAPL